MKLALAILVCIVIGGLYVWKASRLKKARREQARVQAEALALQQFMLQTNRDLMAIIEDTGTPLAARWERAESLLAAVAARNAISDPEMNAWIADNRAYLEQRIGPRPDP